MSVIFIVAVAPIVKIILFPVLEYPSGLKIFLCIEYLLDQWKVLVIWAFVYVQLPDISYIIAEMDNTLHVGLFVPSS